MRPSECSLSRHLSVWPHFHWWGNAEQDRKKPDQLCQNENGDKDLYILLPNVHFILISDRARYPGGENVPADALQDRVTREGAGLASGPRHPPEWRWVVSPVPDHRAAHLPPLRQLPGPRGAFNWLPLAQHQEYITYLNIVIMCVI